MAKSGAKADSSGPEIKLQGLVTEAIKVAKIARKNRSSLTGTNFYAEKMANLRTDATVSFQELADPSVGDISTVAEMIEIVFSPTTDYKSRTDVSRQLVHELRTRKWKTDAAPITVGDSLFPLSLLTKTQRGFMITIGRQMNGSFEAGWFDASAVMMRRLLETCIIEAFEAKGLDSKIKDQNGEFFQLTGLITAALNESTWNLSRNTKAALPKLRDVGHKSAHSRRYTAQRADIEKLSDSFRTALEEFLHLAGLL